MWEDWVYWPPFGAIVGFIYAWRRLRSAEFAIAAARRNPTASADEKIRLIWNIRLRRLRASALVAVYGAIIGAVIGAVLILLVFATDSL